MQIIDLHGWSSYAVLDKYHVPKAWITLSKGMHVFKYGPPADRYG